MLLLHLILLTGTKTLPETFVIDTTTPEIRSIDVTTSEQSTPQFLNSGDVIDFTVTINDSNDYDKFSTTVDLSSSASLNFTIDDVEKSVTLSNFLLTSDSGIFKYSGSYSVDESNVDGTISSFSVSYTDFAGNVGTLRKNVPPIVIDTQIPSVVSVSEPLKNGGEWLGPVRQSTTKADGVYSGLRDTINFKVVFDELIQIPSVDCNCIFLNEVNYTDSQGVLVNFSSIQSITEFDAGEGVTGLSIDLLPVYSPNPQPTKFPAGLILNAVKDLAGNTMDDYEVVPNPIKIIDPNPPHPVSPSSNGIYVNGVQQQRTNIEAGDLVITSVSIVEGDGNYSGLALPTAPTVGLHYYDFIYPTPEEIALGIGIRTENERTYVGRLVRQYPDDTNISSNIAYSLVFTVPTYEDLGFTPDELRLELPEDTFMDVVGNGNKFDQFKTLIFRNE